MGNKSVISPVMKITGIVTIVLTVVMAIVVVISSISNESEALGMLIGTAILSIGVFLGLVEISISEIINILSSEKSVAEAKI